NSFGRSFTPAADVSGSLRGPTSLPPEPFVAVLKSGSSHSVLRSASDLAFSRKLAALASPSAAARESSASAQRASLGLPASANPLARLYRATTFAGRAIKAAAHHRFASAYFFFVYM